MLKSIFWALKDLFLQTFPISAASATYTYGFLIHPRNEDDVLRKYPFFKFLSKPLIRLFTRWFWPVVVTKVTGLATAKGDETIDGYIISIPLIAEQILSNRPLAVRRIRQAVTLAKRMGIKIIGLGGLTASVTAGGEDLLDISDIWITTGHAYTGYNVTQNLFNLEKTFFIDKHNDLVAIVGAAGSIGSISAQLIARAGYCKLLLVDIERKSARVSALRETIRRSWPETEVTESYDISSIKDADFIIAATNTPEALITPDLLKPGAVVIDDAQPSDVAYEVLESPHNLAIEAGVVHTPGISSNFNLGLKGKYDNFCCMAEVLILATHKWQSNFSIKTASLEFVDTIVAWGNHLHFTTAELQNRKEKIAPHKLKAIATLRKRTVQSYMKRNNAISSRRH